MIQFINAFSFSQNAKLILLFLKLILPVLLYIQGAILNYTSQWNWRVIGALFHYRKIEYILGWTRPFFPEVETSLCQEHASISIFDPECDVTINFGDTWSFIHKLLHQPTPCHSTFLSWYRCYVDLDVVWLWHKKKLWFQRQNKVRTIWCPSLYIQHYIKWTQMRICICNSFKGTGYNFWWNSRTCLSGIPCLAYY